VASRLNITEVGRGSNVLKVIFKGNDPTAAVAIVNAVAGAYLEQNVSRGSEEAAKSLEFLDQQLPEIKKRLEQAEDVFNTFRLSSKSIDLDKEATSLLTQAVDLQKARMEAQLRRDMLLQKFEPTHPDVRSADLQIQTIEGDEHRLTDAISKLPETEQQFLRLQRDVTVNATLYTTLLNSSQQLKIAKAGTIGNVRIIDFALPSDGPIGLTRFQIIGASAALGILAGIALGMMLRLLQPSFRSAAAIEASLSLPVYAIVPESKAQDRISIRQQLKKKEPALLYELESNDAAVEALRSMRIALQFAMVNASNKNVLITGPTAGVGKSFIAANLASVLAGAGKRVLLIETDMRRPRFEQIFGLRRGPGLSQYLAGTKSFGEINQSFFEGYLTVVCAGPRPPNPNELLIQGRLNSLLASVQSDFDFIFLDSPPLLPVSDALVVAKMVSTVFLVLRFEQTTPREAHDAVRRLNNSGLKADGVIFNGLKANRLGQGYRYSYYYG